jgi:hypothetical protein
VAGLSTFVTEQIAPGVRCTDCHAAPPGRGTDNTVTPAASLHQSQDFKVPHLRNMYQKTWFDDTPGAQSIDGFGFVHDGSLPSVFRLLSRDVFTHIRDDSVRKTNLNAFVMAFDTGTAPAVGFTRTLSESSLTDPGASNDWDLLQSQAQLGNIDLIAKGTVDGRQRGLVYEPVADTYRSDRTGVGPLTQQQLREKIAAGDILSLMGVPRGSGARMGIDRDLDGILDGDGQPLPVPSDKPALGNISTRARVNTGDHALVVGFIIEGSGGKRVIVRGVGPSLAVADALTDPVLELHYPDGSVVTNDNWRDSQEQEVIATGIPPSNEFDSAIVITLAPGAYTAVLRGNGGAAGAGLVEAYDLDQNGLANLVNISARGLVETGDNVVIAGLIVSGASSAKVLIRALGPSLNLHGALPDPVLELHDENGSVTVNDDWRMDEEAEVTATGIPPLDDRESAMVVHLQAGAYTAIVRGQQDSSGIAVIEAYHLPE